MADEKVTSQKLLKRRRDTALLELALASSYPQTHARNVLHPKRTNDTVPVTLGVGWLHLSVSPEELQTHHVVNERPRDRLHAAAGPLAPAATPKELRSSQHKVGDHSDIPISVAKPWKNPWDK